MRTNRGVRRISIHAPLAGCDQPGHVAERLVVISIHAPLAGCDYRAAVGADARAISIHAPLAGCDNRVAVVDWYYRHFNPRTPCGVRPTRVMLQFVPLNFNPRTPCGVRPGGIDDLLFTWIFQSTHPLRGATRASHRRDNARHGYFNPRTPCGVRLIRLFPAASTPPFQSTHPLRGATTAPQQSAEEIAFQSTHPLRGATAKTYKENCTFLN